MKDEDKNNQKQDKTAPTPEGVGAPTFLPEEEDVGEVLEFEFNEDGEEDLKKTLKKLRNDLKDCKKEKQEYLDGWQRSRADFTNFKQEEGKRLEEMARYSKEKIIEELIPVLDSFDMAFSNKEAWEKVDQNWRVGVEYIYNQLISVLEKNGIKQINEVGIEFDPKIHHSTEIIKAEKESDDHKVVEIIQKGFIMGNKVLRPANVKVYKYTIN
ncbi:MAG: nucleotide exchange factor GrpE [Candidatus Paceibacterota bacterium]|jgi:molecular chaperone GrpE